MFLHVCKQTFRKRYMYVTRELLGLRMKNFQSIIFMLTQTYREIFIITIIIIIVIITFISQ